MLVNFPVVFLKCEMKSMYKEALVLVNIYAWPIPDFWRCLG